ncbi:unnamed protein product [Brassica oleracea]
MHREMFQQIEKWKGCVVSLLVKSFIICFLLKELLAHKISVYSLQKYICKYSLQFDRHIAE